MPLRARVPRIALLGGGAVYNESISDSITAADNITASAIFVSTFTDSITAADSLNSFIAFNLSITDSIASSDSASSIAAFIGSISDTASTGDVASSTALFVSSMSDNAVSSDSTAASISGVPQTYNESITDILVGADSVDGIVVPQLVNAAGSSRRKKYIIDYALQRKVNMHILTLSI
jgi:hypothetical protein